MSGLKRIYMPGERLAPAADEVVAGYGTYVKFGYIYSSLMGHMIQTEERPDAVLVADGDSVPPASTSDAPRQVIQIVPPGSKSERPQKAVSVPGMGDILTVKITHLTPRYVKCVVLCVGDEVLSHNYNAQIRKEDVRKTQKDKVELAKCFRPGDVVLARVINLGDSHTSYNLATDDDSLGVVLARCQEGHRMTAVDFDWMQCTVTQEREPRKIAKVPYLNQTS